jgi:16S rRNA (cytosine967-C5)-methyltransferase
MSISRARTVAYDVLLRVATQNAYADETLRAMLDDQVKSEDAGLATELSLGVLRWQRLLDFAIDGNLTKPPETLDIEVRIALRLGAHQLLFLDRIPPRAAVHESVELVKRARKSSAAPLVNAILRKIAKEQGPGKTPTEVVASALPGDVSASERLGIVTSHPTWMVERWLRMFGKDRTRALLDHDNRAPSTFGYLVASERRQEMEQSLQRAGCRMQRGRLLREAFVLEGGNVATSEAVRKGWLAIQDEASQAVAHIVATEPGNRVLDLCAAPGGKTLLLARAAGPAGRVIAGDLHEHRVRVMRERFAAASVRNVEAIVLDGTKKLPFGETFDRVLVDVPCSGTGTLSRHPEIRWKLQPEDLSDLHERQVLLLRNALSSLAPGGRLVYSTCSLEPEENEDVVKEALEDRDTSFCLVSACSSLEPLLQGAVDVESLFAQDGFFRTFPPRHGTDGFFAAVIERPKA